MNASASSGGEAVAAALRAHAVERVYCVPGESYLAVVDALYDARDAIRLVVCRHEAGAAFMAAAEARLSGRPGVCFVTRGPGASNAAIALHVARQGSIPLVLGVGQVARDKLGREAFQELDYEACFAPLAKHVEQVGSAAALPDAFTRAFECAQAGRPGPVVLALPEDVLAERGAWPSLPPLTIACPAPDPAALERVLALLRAAQRPLIIAGGSDWPDAAGADLERFAAGNDIPVLTAFRRHDLIDNQHPCFAGYLGLGAHEAVWQLAAEADFVLVIGARLDEPTTQGYTLFRDGRPRGLAHLYPDAAAIGLNYAVDVGIVADVPLTLATLAAGARVVEADCAAWRARLRAAFEAAAAPPACSAALDPGAVMAALNARLGDDAVVTVDAGNFSRWPQRYRRYRRPGRLLAPVNGAMGFGVPAAVAAALSRPASRVVGCVGDGGMLMTGSELATAVAHDARPLILVFNNASYGTIEMHQQRLYPGRALGTALVNPDFAAYARAFGLFGERVARNEDLDEVLDAAFAAGRAALIDLQIEGY